MSVPIWLLEALMRQIEPYFPRSRGMARVGGRRVISGNISANAATVFFWL